MKHILVPTDFSTNAEAAIPFAVDIANRFGSEITLLYLYQVHSTTGMFISVESFMKEDAAEHMLPLVRRADSLLRPPARVNSRLLRAETVSGIVDIAEQSGCDLIVMGTQGASGAGEVFLGSTTNGVLRRTQRPVLAIPRGFAFRPFKNIVLAIDDAGVGYAGVLSPLLHLARRYDATIHVFHKDTPENPGIDPSIDLFLADVPHSFHYELDTENLKESINHFVEEVGSDLLCMIRRRRGFLENIFHVSATSREVFSCSVPLLILHDVS